MQFFKHKTTSLLFLAFFPLLLSAQEEKALALQAFFSANAQSKNNETCHWILTPKQKELYPLKRLNNYKFYSQKQFDRLQFRINWWRPNRLKKKIACKRIKLSQIHTDTFAVSIRPELNSYKQKLIWQKGPKLQTQYYIMLACGGTLGHGSTQAYLIRNKNNWYYKLIKRP